MMLWSYLTHGVAVVEEDTVCIAAFFHTHVEWVMTVQVPFILKVNHISKVL